MSSSARSSSAKRSASDNLSQSSEDELDELPDLDTTRSSASSHHDSGIDCGSSIDCLEYPSSPGASSTSSGPVVILRPPGFKLHAQEIRRPKQKKKKFIAILAPDSQSSPNTTELGALRKREPVPPKSKAKRDPLPMRMRAFPQSFWQQPNKPVSNSPANIHKVLPPLSLKDEIDTLRPVTPPSEKDSTNNKPVKKMASNRETKVIVNNNADSMLGKLFENVEEKEKNQTKKPESLQKITSHVSKRTSSQRANKAVYSNNKTMIHGSDPYMVDTITEKLFPHLTLEKSGVKSTHSTPNNQTSIQLITLREGDKTVTLPSLCVEQNYSQMLTDLVPHL